MKNHFCILLSLLITQSVLCQFDSSRTINVYYNTFLVEEYITSINLYAYEHPGHQYDWEYRIGSSHSLSVGVQWQNHKNHSFKFEVMPFRYAGFRTQYHHDLVDSNSYQSFTQAGDNFQIYNSYVRFSYLPVYGKKRIRFLPEVSLKPYFYYISITPLLSGAYFNSAWQTGIMFEFIPGLQYSINKNLGLQFSVPLTLMSFGYERARVDNPALPLHRRTSDDIFIRLLDHILQFQIGLIYKV